MVLDIIQYISEKLLILNPYLRVLTPNCIRLKDGSIVNFIGTEKNDYSINDIDSIGAYIKVNPDILYSEPKTKIYSTSNLKLARADFRIVVYQINAIEKIHPYKVENKITGDLLNLSFGDYTGSEKQIKISVNNSKLNRDSIFIEEIGKNVDTDADFQLVAIDCSMEWLFVNDDCLSDCNVFVNNNVSFVYNSFVVTIKDQDGNVLKTFTTSGTYSVEVLREIFDTIDSNTVTIIDPIE